LRNAVQHSGAARVQLTVTAPEGTIQVVVSDDGAGFAAPRADSAGHFGLAMVAEHVVELGARLRIRTAPGTSWILTVPTP
jgi:signal transduction histidine kinase